MPRRWNGLGLVQKQVVTWCAVPKDKAYLYARIGRQGKGRPGQVLSNLVDRGYLTEAEGSYTQTVLGQKAVALSPTAFDQWRSLA